MEEIVLKSFPFDAVETINEATGQKEYDRLYEAEIFRKYFAKFLSNGVYYGHYKNYGENSMKVTSTGGMNIKVAKGAGIIEGADYENENDRTFILERPTSGTRIDRVVVKLDKTLAVRETHLYIKKGTGNTAAVLQRDENVYEICIAEITLNSNSNVTASNISDKRLDKNLCGIVNSLISVDGEELYEKFKEYIDAVADNLVRKDEASIVLAGTLKDRNGGTSKNNFTDAYKTKLDNIAANANKTTINNTLTSTSTTEALSANMGRKLNDEKMAIPKSGTAVPNINELADGEYYDQLFEVEG